MARDHDDFSDRLWRWAEAHLGDDARIVATRRLPGHSGISFAFDVRTDGDGALERLVIRVPPAGVRRSGITDVLRQVPLLQAVTDAGVPAPRPRWWGDDEQWFGVPYLVVDLVPGATLGDVFEQPLATTAEEAPALWRQAVEALARIHAIDWRERLDGWDKPRPLVRHVERWAHLIERSPEPSWLGPGHALAERLAATAPDDRALGLVHNDFYSNNWMFDGGRLTGVLDWEGTFIGDPLLDVGWVCMMSDRASWSPVHRERIAPSPDPELLAGVYAEATGADLSNLTWYRAFAGLRLASLTAYYLDLHRRGRRRDDVWEDIGASAPFMLARGAEVLGAPAP